MSDKQTVNNAVIGDGVAVAIYQTEAFFAWDSSEIGGEAQRLQVMTGDGAIYDLPELADRGPALAVYRRRLYLAWAAYQEHPNIKVNSSAGMPGQYDPTATITLDAEIYYAPALVATPHYLYLAWANTEGHLCLLRSPDGNRFEWFVELGETTRAAPALLRSWLYLPRDSGGTGAGLEACALAWMALDEIMNVSFFLPGSIASPIDIFEQLTNNKLALPTKRATVGPGLMNRDDEDGGMSLLYPDAATHHIQKIDFAFDISGAKAKLHVSGQETLADRSWSAVAIEHQEAFGNPLIAWKNDAGGGAANRRLSFATFGTLPQI